MIRHLNSGKILPATLPFCEAVAVGNMFYLSGQIGILPGTSQLAPGGIAGETRQAMQNIRATLEAHGLALDNLVRCLIMLADIDEWAAFNEVYAEFFPTRRFPARSAFAASGLALGARVEIECIAAAS